MARAWAPTELAVPSTDEGEALLVAGRSGDVAELSKLLVSRNWEPLSATRDEALATLAMMRFGDYSERWHSEFASLLAGIGLASSPSTAVSDVLGGEPETPRFRENARAQAEAQLLTAARAGHKLTVPYLKELLSMGYKWAYQVELQFEAEARGGDLLEAIVGADAEAGAMLAQLRERYGPRRLSEGMDGGYWQVLRQRYNRLGRENRQRGDEEPTPSVLALKVLEERIVSEGSIALKAGGEAVR